MPSYECTSCDRVETITGFTLESCSACGGALALTEAEQKAMADRIASQNDRFRASWGGDAEVAGRLFFTEGVMAQGAAFLTKIQDAVQSFTSFTPDDDPHGEHDFGAARVEGVKVWWKINLYDPAYVYGSERRDDLAATRRVLTVLLPEEY